MSADFPRAIFAVPGPLDAPTGGYAYARALLAHARGAGLVLQHWPLPGGFPDPDDAALAETGRRLAAAPDDWPILMDGLALGALPETMLTRLANPLIALCHHPLALETGLAPARAAALEASERRALAAAAHVITTSRTTADTLRDVFGVPAARITVAHPGTEAVARARRAGEPAGRPVSLLSVGSLTPRKGHDTLIAALSRLPALDWQLTIHGSADLDPAHAADLRSAIDCAGLGGRIALAGPVPQADLSAAYGAADLFVLAARYEGFGMAFREAMAHGLPTIGCAAGAVPEATCGAAALVPPDDPERLAGVLGPLIADARARAALGTRCAEAAADFARWPDTARTVSEAIAGVIAERFGVSR